MKIGVLGGGRVGGALAQSWQQAGHDVAVSTRETVAETAAGADVVLLAVPASAAPDVLAAAGPLDGKVLIDATNNLSGGPDGAEIAAIGPRRPHRQGVQHRVRAVLRRAAGDAADARVRRRRRRRRRRSWRA